MMAPRTDATIRTIWMRGRSSSSRKRAIDGIVDARVILPSMRSSRWAAFQTPRGRAIGWAIAIGLVTLTITGWAVAIVSATDWFSRSFAIDYGIYMNALDRWQAGGGWYQ